MVTDVIAHSTWINYGVKKYFIPSQLTAEVLAQPRVDESLLEIIGILAAATVASIFTL